MRHSKFTYWFPSWEAFGNDGEWKREGKTRRRREDVDMKGHVDDEDWKDLKDLRQEHNPKPGVCTTKAPIIRVLFFWSALECALQFLMERMHSNLSHALQSESCTPKCFHMSFTCHSIRSLGLFCGTYPFCNLPRNPLPKPIPRRGT